MNRPVYRGQANAQWEVKSGAVRRIEKSHDNELQQGNRKQKLKSLIRDYQKQYLINPLKVMGHTYQSDELMLAELQHHGAATQLVDFTESPLVALWFACSSSEHKEEHGKIFVTDRGSSSVWVNGRDKENKNWLSEDPQAFIYYEPDRSLGARISAQSSLFLVANPDIPEWIMRDVKVAASEKPNILKQLERLKVSEDVLFPDLQGLAKLNSASAQRELIL